MGRTRRQMSAGLYHLNTKGNNGRALYLDDHDRETFLAMVGRVVKRHVWTCHAFCLMTNHYHLLVDTPDESLPKGMQRLNQCYAQSFNRRYGTTGHVFQAPYHSESVTRDSHALMCVRYLAHNPVAAGLCRVPEQWPWSSFGATLGLRRAPSWLTTTWVLGLFADDLHVARRRLREFVNGTRSR